MARAFITGVPIWGILIDCSHHGVAIAGIMSQPFIGETFLGTPGRGTYQRNDQTMPLRTSGMTELASARVFTTTPSLFNAPVDAAFGVGEVVAFRVDRN